MNNPNSALRMMLTYVVIIPLAMLMGYLLTNPLDYGTLGFLGLLIAVIISPIFIKWHYPILVFGLSCPMICFFLIGKPQLSQVVVMLTFVIGITERILSGEKRLISVPVMTWPLLFIAAMAYMTAELNGGIGLHSMGGDTGGGRKYITLFVGVATFFALTSQTIPAHRHRLYIMLFFLPALLGVISDVFPYLPSPLNYINLLFPPTSLYEEGIVVGKTRLVSMSFAVGTIITFMLARYGLRGILSPQRPWRAILFFGTFTLSLLGGFRSAFGALMVVLALMFFLEGLHRTRLLAALILPVMLAIAVLVSFSDKLPYTFQRAMSFLPLKWEEEVLADADASSEWRYNMWRALWPKVPQYLLLGKGYAISKDDYEMMGGGQFAYFKFSHIDASEESLAISSDYHSGPLTTLIPFGIWGAIGIVWLMGATVFVLYRNYRYGDPTLKAFNSYMLAACVGAIVSFFFVFGGFNNDVGNFARLAGFSIAMNGGLGKRPAKAASNPRFKPLAVPIPVAV